MQRHTIFLYAFLTMLFLMSQPAHALLPISDSEMGDTTGCAGVSMVIDDMNIFQSISRLDYIDPDGCDFSWLEPTMVGQAGPARARLMGLDISGLHIEAISPGSQMGVHGPHFDISQSNDLTNLQFKPMTFDVASGLASLFWSSQSDTRAGLLIGLPTLDVYTEQFKLDGIYFDGIDRSGLNNHTSLVKVSMQGADIALLDGSIGLMSHKGSGIDIGMDDIQIYVKIDEMKFTDDDGVWNLINEVYQNIPQVNNPNDRALPYSVAIRDFEIDTLRINSLVFNVGSNPNIPEVHSPGKTDAHAGLQEMKHFTWSDVPTLSGDMKGRPLQIDIGSGLPTATALARENGSNQTFLGILVSLPTLEMYAKEISIGGIYVCDPQNDTTQIPVLNENTSFMQVHIEDGLTAVLSGKLEIMAH
jgi:hypothetical protein